MADLEALIDELHGLLLGSGVTVATAESLTGGRVAAALTARGGSSAYFLGGVVSYASSVKESVLGVPAEVIDRDGTVSEGCARAMAEGVRRLTGATYGVSTTGVAGPDSSEGHPVGTLYVAAASATGTRSARFDLGDHDRSAVQRRAAVAALSVLRDSVRRNVGGLG